MMTRDKKKAHISKPTVSATHARLRPSILFCLAVYLLILTGNARADDSAFTPPAADARDSGFNRPAYNSAGPRDAQPQTAPRNSPPTRQTANETPRQPASVEGHRLKPIEPMQQASPLRHLTPKIYLRL